MITIGEIQISGMLTMLMLSVMLALCVPQRSAHRGSFATARWMTAAGTGLIAMQFLLQYVFGFRQMGVTQGVLVNLLFFTPASLLCSMSVLYVLRQGCVSRREWLVSWSVCGMAAILLIGTALLDGVPIEQESPVLRLVEYGGSLLYVGMQSYIFKHQYIAYRKLEQVIDEYFDCSRRDLFGWMGWSMKAMAVLAFFVPLVIFMTGAPLVLFSIAYFFCIAYSTISLYSYGISENHLRVEDAEKIENERFFAEPSGRAERLDEPSDKESSIFNLPSSIFHLPSSISEAVERWKENGAYREHNLTLGVVARQMGVPQKQLQEWLRQSEYKKLAGLVATLRIEEAKRVLKEHPDWSIESVADHCGFNDRKYFHEVFRQQTGMTPARYQSNT